MDNAIKDNGEVKRSAEDCVAWITIIACPHWRL